jgi:aryl-alcohol dehydrogenase-like predicted oxidoreductase
MMTGSATMEGTARYAGRHAALTYQPFGGEWQVSQAGFGGYRVDAAVEEHRKALALALRSGINLIDTSSNYADGGSEKLVGEVLAELKAKGDLRREEVVVVSKVGYLQGQNYRLSQARKAEGRPFPDLVEYAEGLEHCIHPEFLEDQLTRSLERLGLATLDVYLLHNPEYFLGWAQKAGVPLAEARAEYARRIELAFRQLEREVERGRIRCYGISSNTFPATRASEQFTSLEKVWEIAGRVAAEHHFRVIQLPMNLYETGGVTERNQSTGESAVDFARGKGLSVMINRPLNAVVGGQMTRLAEPELPDGAEELGAAEAIAKRLAALVRLEEQLRAEVLSSLGSALGEKEREQVLDRLSAGKLLEEHGMRFASKEHWQEVLSQFLVPSVQQGIGILLRQAESSEAAAVWVEKYAEQVNGVLQAFTAHHGLRAMAAVHQVREQAAAADGEWGVADSLQATAIRALRSTAGIDVVLVGMRREAYVEDVIAELSRPEPRRERHEAWEQVRESLQG